MTRTGRTTLGVFAIIALISLEALIVILLANRIAHWPVAAQTLFYLVAGIVWLVPLRPLLVWMNKA